ncbi:hypothetical protein G7046_g3349 [Stylonectria norvegica]|nr:hypothetical protein G7046_g3349 [Stylonectria norvegica]
MPASPSSPSFAQLEQAALHIVRLIKDTPGLENTRLAVIGDLAVCKYLPLQDRIMSIDFVISKSSSPGRVKKEIVGHPMSPLIEKSGAVFYRHASGWEIEVKLAPDWLCPYLPSSAQRVRDVQSLPYATLDDLIVFKADACGLRECVASKQREARHAAALLQLASEHSPLKLDEDKMDRIDQALSDVVEHSLPEHNKSWWQRHLGQSPDERRSAQDILSELADHTFSTPQSPSSSSSKRSSIYSSMSRTPSSGSSISAHSAASSISSTHPSDDKLYEKNGRPRKMSVTGKTPRHKRHTSTGVAVPHALLDVAMQRLEIERSASPGIALTNRI